MSSKKRTEGPDVTMMQRRIDEGILLAQRRLLDRGLHDDLSVVICQGGVVCEVAAREINKF